MKQEVILVLDCGATNVRRWPLIGKGTLSPASTANASDIAMGKQRPGTSGR